VQTNDLSDGFFLLVVQPLAFSQNFWETFEIRNGLGQLRTDVVDNCGQLLDCWRELDLGKNPIYKRGQMRRMFDFYANLKTFLNSLLHPNDRLLVH